MTEPGGICPEIGFDRFSIPLFIEELTKSIVEAGLSAESGASATPAIPTTLQGSLLARLDRLGGTREVTQFGAAIGREFEYGLLAAIADLPEVRLCAGLSELEAAGLVSQSQEAAIQFARGIDEATPAEVSGAGSIAHDYRARTK